MDEIEAPEIIFALEESFNISIGSDGKHPGDLFFRVARTVGALIEYVDRLVAEQS
jgi:acyl carrier protein